MDDQLKRLQIFLATVDPTSYRNIKSRLSAVGIPTFEMHGGGESNRNLMAGAELNEDEEFRGFAIKVLSKAVEKFRVSSDELDMRMKKAKLLRIWSAILAVISSAITSIAVFGDQQWAYIPAIISAISSICTILAGSFGGGSEKFWELRDRGSALAAKASLLLSKFESGATIWKSLFNEETVSEIDEIVIGLESIANALFDDGLKAI